LILILLIVIGFFFNFFNFILKHFVLVFLCQIWPPFFFLFNFFYQFHHSIFYWFIILLRFFLDFAFHRVNSRLMTRVLSHTDNSSFL
jgi:hypothetical protein